MEIEFTKSAYKDYQWWEKRDPKKFERIKKLCRDVLKRPFTGIGKPEPLRHEWQGFWSRRISGEHRLVYRVEAGRLYILQARYHY